MSPFFLSACHYKRYAGIIAIRQTQATGVKCAISELGRLTYALVSRHRFVPVSPEEHSRPKTCNDGERSRLYDYDHIYWRSYRGAQPDILIRSRNTTLRICVLGKARSLSGKRHIPLDFVGCCVCRYVSHFHLFGRNHDFTLGIRRDFKGTSKDQTLQLDAPARSAMAIITAEDNYQAITLQPCSWASCNDCK